MIPCQTTCPHYCPGCHKGCLDWQVRQSALREERRKKRAYITYYNELCRTVTRQYRALSPLRPR